jgi:hypothetical protein
MLVKIFQLTRSLNVKLKQTGFKYYGKIYHKVVQATTSSENRFIEGKSERYPCQPGTRLEQLQEDAGEVPTFP